jgi:FtsP/CotA-like multicopper oxidase with cupredoxin domain
MRFRTFTGMYVFHCHILNHEDNGMMGVVNVS